MTKRGAEGTVAAARDSIPTSGVGTERALEKRSDANTNKKDSENMLHVLKKIESREKRAECEGRRD